VTGDRYISLYCATDINGNNCNDYNNDNNNDNKNVNNDNKQ